MCNHFNLLTQHLPNNSTSFFLWLCRPTLFGWMNLIWAGDLWPSHSIGLRANLVVFVCTLCFKLHHHHQSDRFTETHFYWIPFACLSHTPCSIVFSGYFFSYHLHISSRFTPFFSPFDSSGHTTLFRCNCNVSSSCLGGFFLCWSPWFSLQFRNKILSKENWRSFIFGSW